jgi:phosphoribosylformylglycinamidine synthase
VRLSANWMAACGEPGEDAALYAAVRAVGEQLCPALGIAIPVGKDSLSMQTVWQDGTQTTSVVAPISLIISAFAPVRDVRRTLTPVLQLDRAPPRCCWSIWARPQSPRHELSGAGVQCRPAASPPTSMIRSCWPAWRRRMIELRARGLLLAYHDRSDGGLLVTLAEMAFAGHCGVDVTLAAGSGAGRWRGCSPRSRERCCRCCNRSSARCSTALPAMVWPNACSSSVRRWRTCGCGSAAASRCSMNPGSICAAPGPRLHTACAGCAMIRMCRGGNGGLLDEDDPGLSQQLSFDPQQDIAAPLIARGARPRVAVLREQGVNGQVEMAAVLDRAGFEAHDVHMSDLLGGERTLEGFSGLVACGGFSYGDVLGAGGGWARSILFHERTRARLRTFLRIAATPSRSACATAARCLRCSGN